MLAFERILCPTDFSRYSFRAADYAVSLAKYYDGEIHFLHVVPKTILGSEQYPYVREDVAAGPELRERALERLDAFVALSRAEGARSRISVEEGTPVQVILSTAEADRASLICLGTHGRTGVERLILGSVTERVLRMAKCPVLTVSEPRDEGAAKEAVFRSILCAVDFESYSLKALEYSLSLAQQAGGRLMLFHAPEGLPEEVEPGSSLAEYRARTEETLAERLDAVVPDGVRDWCDVEIVVRAGKPYRGILALAEERAASLIAMGVRGKRPLHAALFGSTAQHVVRHARCPVLTVSQGN